MSLSRGCHVLACLLTFAAAACAPDPPANVLRVSGHVEATEVHVAAEVGGRIVELRVAEGDRLHRGDVIATLDTRDTELQIQRGRADRAGAVAQLKLLEAGARVEDVRQAEAEVQGAEAETMAIEADLKAAQLDLDRAEALLQANAIAQKQRDDARAKVEGIRERQRGSQQRVRAAREAVIRLKKGARAEELDAARARVAAADAQLAVLDKALADAQITAPVSGIITQKLVDAGEIVMRGTAIVVVTDLDNAWANLFVPEPMVPRVKLGQSAKVVTDAGGDGLTGTVTFISPKAEFTPRNVQTAEERSKLVYRIKVSVDNRSGVLKSGMPVDAELALQ
jgi:HlyD family secretion protein